MAVAKCCFRGTKGAYVILSEAKNQVGRRESTTFRMMVMLGTLVLNVGATKNGRLILRFAQDGKGWALAACIRLCADSFRK